MPFKKKKMWMSLLQNLILCIDDWNFETLFKITQMRIMSGKRVLSLIQTF